MDMLQLVVLVVIGCCTLGSFGQLTVSCPMGCQDSVCYASLGCTGSCMPGWCKSYAGLNYGVFCTMQCGKGQICMNGFCTHDNSNNEIIG